MPAHLDTEAGRRRAHPRQRLRAHTRLGAGRIHADVTARWRPRHVDAEPAPALRGVEEVEGARGAAVAAESGDVEAVGAREEGHGAGGVEEVDSAVVAEEIHVGRR